LSVTPYWKSSFGRGAGLAALVLAGMVAGETVVTEVDSSGTGIVQDSGAVFYTLRIEEATLGPNPSVDTIAILLGGGDAFVAGFSFRIGLDHPEIQIDKILPGEIVDSCHWELFSPRDGSSTSSENDPEQVWSIVGLAKSSGDTSIPQCYSFDREASLCKIVLSFEPLPGIEVSEIPLFFYWKNCRDNLLTDLSGGQLSIANQVIDHNGDTLSNESGVLPSLAGTPESCFNTAAQNHPRRIVNFLNGVIRISVVESH